MKTRKTGDQTRDAILDFVSRYYLANGIAPTIREIRDGVGLASTNTVIYHLDLLAADGQIKRYDNIARGIVPV